MAHELVTVKGQVSFAARGGAKTAWHGMGQEILPGDSLATIGKKAGLDFSVHQAKVTYKDKDGKTHEFADRVVNYCADTGAGLGIVSTDFKNVQPSQVLAFFKDFLSANKLAMETAGAVRGRKVIWAMAKLGKDYNFLMPGGDKIDSYVRLQTAFDGTRCTDLVATTTRQVCANTMAMVDLDANRSGFRIPHSAVFDAKALQRAFGLVGEQHKVTAKLWNALCERKVTIAERDAYFQDLFGLRSEEQVKAGKPADLAAIDPATKKPAVAIARATWSMSLWNCSKRALGLRSRALTPPRSDFCRRSRIGRTISPL